MSKRNRSQYPEIWGQDATYILEFRSDGKRFEDKLLFDFAEKLINNGLGGAKLITSLFCEYSPHTKGKMYTTFWKVGDQILAIGCQYELFEIKKLSIIITDNPGENKFSSVLWDYVYQRNQFSGFFLT